MGGVCTYDQVQLAVVCMIRQQAAMTMCMCMTEQQEVIMGVPLGLQMGVCNEVALIAHMLMLMGVEQSAQA